MRFTILWLMKAHEARKKRQAQAGESQFSRSVRLKLLNEGGENGGEVSSGDTPPPIPASACSRFVFHYTSFMNAITSAWGMGFTYVNLISAIGIQAQGISFEGSMPARIADFIIFGIVLLEAILGIAWHLQHKNTIVPVDFPRQVLANFVNAAFLTYILGSSNVLIGPIAILPLVFFAEFGKQTNKNTTHHQGLGFIQAPETTTHSKNTCLRKMTQCMERVSSRTVFILLSRLSQILLCAMNSFTSIAKFLLFWLNGQSSTLPISRPVSYLVGGIYSFLFTFLNIAIAQRLFATGKTPTALQALYLLVMGFNAFKTTMWENIEFTAYEFFSITGSLFETSNLSNILPVASVMFFVALAAVHNAVSSYLPSFSKKSTENQPQQQEQPKAATPPSQGKCSFFDFLYKNRRGPEASETPNTSSYHASDSSLQALVPGGGVSPSP